MLTPLIQTLISGIFVLVTIINLRKAFRKSSSRPILKDLQKWNSDKKSFIEFKKYEYDRQFWYVNLFFVFYSILFGIFLALHHILIKVIGFYPWIVLVLCSLYPTSKFLISIIPKANNQAINNMKILLESKK